MMKAVLSRTYGGPEKLTVESIPIPKPKENELLIRVHACAINDYDWSVATGKPFIYRLFFGFTKPKQAFLGMEFSGVIEAIGSNSSEWQIGDVVYGDSSDMKLGTMAEYICLVPKGLRKKPHSLSFEEAASLSHAGCLAFQGLEMGKLKPNMRVLINGAGGGVGTLALQLAKANNCHVSGVDTGDKLAWMLELGFDEVIDYKQVDFTQQGIQYDLILDAKTSFSSWKYLKALYKGGAYISIGGAVPKLLNLLFLGRLIGKIAGKSFRILGLKTNRDLAELEKFVLEGKLKPEIDGPYPIYDSGGQLARFGKGLHKGKIIIKIHK